ncbi:hypothetical protein MGYG_06067 [Nannizzia gypsea CBS 118893]|uniref:Uncharacterized protein n=1 Tax=Arthroderma gypseum (strain ATCC MYA-4604 / CBS 118893) TaxID=535722 RepID=E4V0D2_ARTGP|nr:hypothetical protein MGYG_06067 [Nannizzia gypsea CBS 118893]EFR03069.1 hypothetical protein MGYG_06067 [Nannizzia gypsea CBS 118893]
MANIQRLLDYLMVPPPGQPTMETHRSPNTSNDSYKWSDIRSVGQWTEFTYAHIIQRYGVLLQEAEIQSEPMPDSPPQPIRTEPMFAVRVTTYIQSRLRRALRAGFQHNTPQLANLTPITVDIGDAAQIINNFRPDIAFFHAGTPLGSSPNRCPGDLKVSWKWGSNWQTAQSVLYRKEYLQVLSQVNYYMKQHNTQYGFVLTNTELVPIKRLDARGNLLVAQAIPWEAAGPGRLTILLGLWYIGMLGADNNWQLQ